MKHFKWVFVIVLFFVLSPFILSVILAQFLEHRKFQHESKRRCDQLHKFHKQLSSSYSSFWLLILYFCLILFLRFLFYFAVSLFFQNICFEYFATGCFFSFRFFFRFLSHSMFFCCFIYFWRLRKRYNLFATNNKSPTISATFLLAAHNICMF